MSKKREALRRGLRSFIEDTSRELADLEGRALRPPEGPEADGDTVVVSDAIVDVAEGAATDSPPSGVEAGATQDRDLEVAPPRHEFPAGVGSAPEPPAATAPVTGGDAATGRDTATDLLHGTTDRGTATDRDSATPPTASLAPRPVATPEREPAVGSPWMPQPSPDIPPPAPFAEPPAAARPASPAGAPRASGPEREPGEHLVEPEEASRHDETAAAPVHAGRPKRRAKPAVRRRPRQAAEVVVNGVSPQQAYARKGVCFAYFLNHECWRVPDAYCNGALQVCITRECPIYHLHKDALERRFARKFKHFW